MKRLVLHPIMTAMLIIVFCSCSSSGNNDPLEGNYYATSSESGYIIKISERQHKLVLQNTLAQMGLFTENASDITTRTHDLQTCLSSHWSDQYGQSEVNAIIFEEDGAGSYELHFVTVTNPVFNRETKELSFDAYWFAGTDPEDSPENGIALSSLIIVFMNDPYTPKEVTFSEDVSPENTINAEDASNDLTWGIINTYEDFARDFDNAVNKMIEDAAGQKDDLDKVSSQISNVTGMLNKTNTGSPLSADETAYLINLGLSNLPSCSNLSETSCLSSWNSVLQSGINALNNQKQILTESYSKTQANVKTAQLTTDGMVVQAKQSIRDTVGGAASTVFKTLQKLAQQLGQ
jgi:hypothetical protein